MTFLHGIDETNAIIVGKSADEIFGIHVKNYLSTKVFMTKRNYHKKCFEQKNKSKFFNSNLKMTRAEMTYSSKLLSRIKHKLALQTTMVMKQ